VKPLANPAAKKKAIGLGIAVGLVFLFVVKNTMSAIAGGGQAPPEGTAVPLPTGGGAPASGDVVAMAPPAGGLPTAVKPADDLLDPPNYTLADTPTPFHKDTVGYSGPLDYKPVDDLIIPPPIITPPRFRVPRSNSKQGGLIGTLPGVGGSGDSAVVVRDPDPIILKGVMAGQNPVAVIQVGTKQFVVSKGNTFGSKETGRTFHLKDVTASQVVIDEGGTLHILRVGASPPPAGDQSAPKQIAL
jgi:hypothetical protein